jgi:hypothetical protein
VVVGDGSRSESEWLVVRGWWLKVSGREWWSVSG